ncbi:hypothetical protein ACOSQ3_010914 [Xanthoceras sorbifolium]
MGGLSYSENNLTVQVDPSLIGLASNNSMSVKGNGLDPMDSENHVVDELEAGPVFHFISEGGPKRRWEKQARSECAHIDPAYMKEPTNKRKQLLPLDSKNYLKKLKLSALVLNSGDNEISASSTIGACPDQ